MSRAALPDAWRQPPVLSGRHATLEPMTQEHVDALAAVVHGSGLDQLWYTSVPAPEHMAAYVDAVLAAQAEGKVLPFVVRNAEGAVVGTTRFYGLDPSAPRLNIGYTWYAPSVQRTGINTECKLMLLGHAFETLGCVRVGFETSWYNLISRAAIARLGAKQEAVLRQYTRHADGTLRDTVVFSIIDAEWSSVRHHLRHRLDVKA